MRRGIDLRALKQGVERLRCPQFLLYESSIVGIYADLLQLSTIRRRSSARFALFLGTERRSTDTVRHRQSRLHFAFGPHRVLADSGPKTTRHADQCNHGALAWALSATHGRR